MNPAYPCYIANRPEQPNTGLAVTNKFSGKTATRVPLVGTELIERAIAAAVTAAPVLARMPPFERQAVLRHCVRRFEERAAELADNLCIEAGKPIKDSRGEVARLIDTFQIAADESVRPHGEMLQLELGKRTRGYRGFTKRVRVIEFGGGNRRREQYPAERERMQAAGNVSVGHLLVDVTSRQRGYSQAGRLDRRKQS